MKELLPQNIVGDVPMRVWLSCQQWTAAVLMLSAEMMTNRQKQKLSTQPSSFLGSQGCWSVRCLSHLGWVISMNLIKKILTGM